MWGNRLPGEGRRRKRCGRGNNGAGGEEEGWAVVVVVELRAEDVVREFLQQWLDLSAGAEWEIWSVGGLLDGPYAAWVGWKHATQSSGG